MQLKITLIIRSVNKIPEIIFLLGYFLSILCDCNKIFIKSWNIYLLKVYFPCLVNSEMNDWIGNWNACNVDNEIDSDEKTFKNEVFLNETWKIWQKWCINFLKISTKLKKYIYQE